MGTQNGNAMAAKKKAAKTKTASTKAETSTDTEPDAVEATDKPQRTSTEPYRSVEYREAAAEATAERQLSRSTISLKRAIARATDSASQLAVEVRNSIGDASDTKRTAEALKSTTAALSEMRKDLMLIEGKAQTISETRNLNVAATADELAKVMGTQ